MFSVVIPVGPGRSAAAALGSLTRAGLEVDDHVCVIIDTSNCLAKLPSLPCGVTVLRSTHNIGACNARNLGANSTSNRFITFLDDDDAFLPGAITQLRLATSAAPHQPAWCMAWQLRSENRPYPHHTNRSFTRRDMYYRNIIGGTSTLTIDRALFNTVGGFDAKLRSLQDWDIFLRILDHTNIVLVPNAVILYDDESPSRISTSRTRRLSGQTRFIKKHWSKLPLAARAFHFARLTKVLATT